MEVHKSKPRPPVLRGLIKVHREDTTIRQIVSLRNAPSYNLAKMFTNTLKTNIPLPYTYNVLNSIQVMKDLADISCVPGLKIASLNISNMHTNIPIKDLLDIIDVMCKNHNLESTLIQEILKITRLITTQNYFKFRDKMYLQKNGLAMGAPTSSILSEIYLQYLENTKIYDILSSSKIQGCFRYVDDILVIYNRNYTYIEEVQNSFNNITPGLNFTLELENDNKLNFLDLTITETANKLPFDKYRKHTSTNIIILHDSCHPPEQKLAAIRYYVNRINAYNINHEKDKKKWTP
jgi:hypothetical protein